MQTSDVRVSPVGRDALDALFATGQWLHSRQRYADASAVFRVIVLCAPDEERGYLALGACHEGLGQDSIALEIYGMAVLTLPAPRCRKSIRAEPRHGLTSIRY